VDVPEFTFPIEDLLGPLAAQAERFREGSKELDYLGDVIIIFAIFGAGLWVE
jgi:hypothetical protein